MLPAGRESPFLLTWPLSIMIAVAGIIGPRNARLGFGLLWLGRGAYSIRREIDWLRVPLKDKGAQMLTVKRVGLRPAISPLPDRLLSAALARRMGLSLWAVACLKHHDVLTLHPDNRLGRHDEGRGCDD
jgi:hypothetical protein